VYLNDFLAYNTVSGFNLTNLSYFDLVVNHERNNLILCELDLCLREVEQLKEGQLEKNFPNIAIDIIFIALLTSVERQVDFQFVIVIFK